MEGDTGKRKGMVLVDGVNLVGWAVKMLLIKLPQ